MHPKAPRCVPAVLDVIPFPAPPGEVARVRCVECSGPLDLHQPDDDSPDRLLGVCKSCRRWSVIELMPDQAEAVIIVLPEAGRVLTALRAGGGDSGRIAADPFAP